MRTPAVYARVHTSTYTNTHTHTLDTHACNTQIYKAWQACSRHFHGEIYLRLAKPGYPMHQAAGARQILLRIRLVPH